MIPNSHVLVDGMVPCTKRPPIASRSARRLSRAARLALAAGLLVASQAGAQTWTRLARNAPGNVELMQVMPDGTIMCAQNGGAIGKSWYKLTPDIHGSYQNGTWTQLADAHDTRLYYSSQLLPDGRLFIAGGEYGTGGAKAEVYDPATNTWTQLTIPTTVLDPSQPSPVIGANQIISDAVSEILADRSVLIGPVGPAAYAGTIKYNPTSNQWTTGPNIVHGGTTNESAWVKLPDQSILTVDPFSQTTERYMPATNTWITDRSVPVALYDLNDSEIGPGCLLPNGKVIFIGATGHTAVYTPSGGTGLGNWIIGPDVPGNHAMPDASAAMQPNGKLLCVVSNIPAFPGDFPVPSYFVEYDYVSNSFASVGAPNGLSDPISSFQGTLAVLPEGKLLYSHMGPDLYVYTPSSAALPAMKPTVVSVTPNADGSFHLTGRNLNGLSEGSWFGDDLQNNSNFPLVRLVNTATNNVYYARTYNWTSTGVMTGNLLVGADYRVPATLPSGNYNKFVVVNGVASDPFSVGANNDNCADAITIAEGSTPFSTSGSTTDGPLEPNGGLGADAQITRDIGYRYVASCTGSASLTISDPTYDSRAAGYYGVCPTGPGTAIAVNDNACGVASALTFAALQGHSYLIRVGGTADATGAGTVTIACSGASNDFCANEAPIFEGSTPFSTIGATTDGPVEPQLFPGADPQVNQDFWFVYVASCAGQATASLCGADFDTRIAIYNGVCPSGPGTAIAGNDNFCGTASKVTWNTQYHQTYTIRIGGAGNSVGTGTIVLACSGCYANCDGSTTPPALNINDFTCFLNKFAAGDSYANCDNSTTPPTLNINDFTCFLNRFAAGC